MVGILSTELADMVGIRRRMPLTATRMNSGMSSREARRHRARAALPYLYLCGHLRW